MTGAFAYPVAAVSRILAGAGLLMALSAAPVPAQEFHDSDTLKLGFGTFSIFGTYSKQACSAQANMRSARGQRVGFSIYWRPGKSLYLLTTHPAYQKAAGQQQVQFRFPDGSVMVFPMRRSGAKLQTNIGFGAKARKFYDAITASRSVRIEMPGVGDAVDVDLSNRRQVEGGMRYCKKWLK